MVWRDIKTSYHHSLKAILIGLSTLSLFIMLIAANNNIGAYVVNSRWISLRPQEKVEIVKHVIEWMAETGLSLSHAAKIIKVSRTNLSIG